MKTDTNLDPDLRYDLKITLEEAATGQTAQIEFPRLIKCNQCNGKGSIPQKKGFFSLRCLACEGARQITQATRISVKVPAGVENGSRLRIPSMGDDDLKSGKVGDLYVVIAVAEHDVFRRAGSDLFATIPVSKAQLQSGTKVNFPTITDGQKQLRVPPLTKNGQRFRVKGQGMPRLEGQKRGDLFISVSDADDDYILRTIFGGESISSPQSDPAAQVGSVSTETAPREARKAHMKPYSDSPRLLRIFLCHSSGDKAAVRELSQRLKSSGLETWLDEEKLLPGQRWRDEIPRAVRESDLVIVCLSKASVNKAGYVQREIRYALDAALEQPENSIFLIPLRLEDCEVPDSLSDWQWVDYFDESGYERLRLALDYRAEALGVIVDQSAKPAESPTKETTSTEEEAAPVKVSTTVDAEGTTVLPHAIGIETLGGVFTKMIPEGTPLPHRFSEIFSTPTDNQASVEVHVLAGLRPMAQQNLSLGKFNLVGIPPAPRGVPEIEVTFDIDEGGLLNVSAKDLLTGREQKITITAASDSSRIPPEN
ncbi:MAG TPA: DnaJ C-terminal domain-containing protein [Pyrinomonadaceae bacterium]|nr:DnaJ C-terminal domain-containing protein [Pyrinomonadaceae bacterium]